jgi:NAD-dependent deacetylase
MTGLHDDPTIREAARWIVRRGGAAVLTGAGVSVESGIPDFRSDAGVWTRFDPMEYATISAFRQDPVKVWRFLYELDALVRGARPNPAHRALALLEDSGWIDGIATQNVDGLHQRAGSRRVIELHGSGRRLVCLGCGRRYPAEEAGALGDPPRCLCGQVLKPDATLFGEDLPEGAYEGALALVRAAPVLLVGGTSAQVYPAAALPAEARRAGALVIEVNTEPTVLTGDVAEISIHHPAGVALPALEQAVREASQRGASN